jgi:hypothetical protein
VLAFVGCVGCGGVVAAGSEEPWEAQIGVGAGQAAWVVALAVVVSRSSRLIALICSSVIMLGSGEFSRAPKRPSMLPVVICM